MTIYLVCRTHITWEGSFHTVLSAHTTEEAAERAMRSCKRWEQEVDIEEFELQDEIK